MFIREIVHYLKFQKTELDKFFPNFALKHVITSTKLEMRKINQRKH